MGAEFGRGAQLGDGGRTLTLTLSLRKGEGTLLSRRVKQVRPRASRCEKETDARQRVPTAGR